VTKPNPENRKNCSSKCAYDYAKLQYIIFTLASRQPSKVEKELTKLTSLFNRQTGIQIDRTEVRDRLRIVAMYAAVA